MSNVAQRRICNELKSLQSNHQFSQLFSISSPESNLYLWMVTINGPENTPYYGYSFNLHIVFTDEYPLKPPNVKFVTPIQHVNINAHGDICLDIIKNKWSCKLNMTNVLLSIVSLLIDPNSSDPFNSELASLYTTNIDEYTKYIIDHCSKFATKITN